MYGPYDNYAALLIVEGIGIPAPVIDAKAIERETKAALAEAEIVRGRSQLLGQHMLLAQPDGTRRLLGRSRLYSLALPGELGMLAAVRAHVARIAQLGPGTVWFLGEPVHIVTDDGMTHGAVRAGDPREFMLVRTYYGHEIQAVPA